MNSRLRLERFARARIERRHGADDARLALRDDEVGSGGDEHRPGHDRQFQGRLQAGREVGVAAHAVSPKHDDALIERLSLAHEPLEERPGRAPARCGSRAYRRESTIPVKRALSAVTLSGERPQARARADAGDGVAGEAVQDRPVEAAASRRLRVGMQRVPVAGKAVDQRRARFGGEARLRVRLAIGQDRGRVRRRRSAETAVASQQQRLEKAAIAAFRSSRRRCRAPPRRSRRAPRRDP